MVPASAWVETIHLARLGLFGQMNSSWKGLLNESEVSSSTRYLTTGSPPSESGGE